MKFPKQAADEAGATSINKRIDAEETLRQKNRIASLERDIQRRDNEIRDLTQALDNEQRVAEALREAMDKAQGRISDLEKGFEERMARCRELRDALKVERERADAAEAKLEAGNNPSAVQTRAAPNNVPSLQDLMDDDSYMKETLVLDDDDEEDAAGTSMHAQTLPTLEDDLVAADLIFPEDGDDPEAADLDLEPLEPSTHTDSGVLDSSFVRTLAIVLDDGAAPIRHPIYKPHVTIGRSSHADIQIASDFVSRVHAHIVTDEKGTHIEDAGSKNGVKVNGVRVATQLPIKAGDTVRLGRFEFRVVELS